MNDAKPQYVLSAISSLAPALLDSIIRKGDRVGRQVVDNMAWIRVLDEARTDAVRSGKRSYECMSGGGGAAAGEVASRRVAAAVAASDATFALADSAYAVLDTSVLMLDGNLRFLEALLRAQSGLSQGEEEGEGKREAGRPSGGASISSRTRRTLETGGPASSSSRQPILPSSHSLAALALSTHTGGGGAGDEGEGGRKKGGVAGLARSMGGVMDLKIDPDEPTYCSCGQVAFGEMIACDSAACPVEWYHCMCVGVTPTGRSSATWLCPLCKPKEGGGGGTAAGGEERGGGAGAAGGAAGPKSSKKRRIA